MGDPKRRTAVAGLVAPLALVVLILAGYVWWRETAHLNATELRQLSWPTIRSQAWDHVLLTVCASVLVVLIAVPLGILLTRRGTSALAPVVVGIANVGQSAPAVGLLVLLYIWLNSHPFWTGFRVSVLALTLYGLLPVLRNTITGLRGVDPTLVEAARGVGMSVPSVLFRVELPLALPVIMAGIRTTLVLVVGTATLATFISGGGLGDTISSGISLYQFRVMVAGAVLVAALALLVEWVGRVLEVVIRPKGV
ncbi:ABC transporter permease [Nocardioides maradonensis]